MSNEVTMPVDELVEELAPQRWFRPYPEYHDSGIQWLGQVPHSWALRRIKYVARVIMGQSPASDDYSLDPDDLPFLQGNADFGPRSPIPRVYCPTATKRVPPRALLLSVRAPVGALNIADQTYGIGRGLCAVVPCETKLLASYAWYLLQVIREELHTQATGSTYQAVSANEVAAMTSLLPTLDEQRAITDFLERETAQIDELIAKKQRLIDLLHERRRLLVDNVFSACLPENWTTERLKFSTHFVTSGSRGWAEFYTDDGAVFIRIGNLSRDSIDLDLRDIQHVTPPAGTEGERTRVQAGDVLVSVTAYIGSIGVVPQGLGEAYVNQHTALVRLKPKVCNPRWVAYSLFSRFGIEQLRASLYGGTKEGLSLDDVKNVAIVKAPRQEQDAIVAQLDVDTRRVTEAANKIADAIARLREYRSALISAAVTGKIDVRNV